MNPSFLEAALTLEAMQEPQTDLKRKTLKLLFSYFRTSCHLSKALHTSALHSSFSLFQRKKRGA